MTPERWISLAALIATAGFALWKGGRTERVYAILLSLAWLLTPLVQLHGRWRQPQLGVAALDAALFAATLAIALRSPRFWPLLSAPWTLLLLATETCTWLSPRLFPWAAYVGAVIWSYLLLVALAFGTWWEVVRPRRRSG